jgi:hypothetical protein
MPPKENEVDKLFDGLPEEDRSEFNLEDDQREARGEQTPAKDSDNNQDKDNDDEGDVRKNRRHRRLERQLEAERNMNIALNERVKILSSNIKPADSTDDLTAMPPEWVALYGNTPESEKAWQMQSSLLQKHTERAKKEALLEFETQQRQAMEKQKGYEEQVTTELEALEDEFNVDLTSNSPAARKTRNDFLELVEKLSPKDANGNIIGYADFGQTFEIFKESKAKSKSSIVDKQKEIASRSMQTSGPNSGAQNQQTTRGFHGWKKDYNITKN